MYRASTKPLNAGTYANPSGAALSPVRHWFTILGPKLRVLGLGGI